MRIALVGLGHAGFSLHLPALSTMRSVSVVGACDPDAARCEMTTAKFGVPAFSNFDEMLAAARPELVIIGTPPSTHADYCLRAIAAGAHVLCEKPFVSTLAEADRVMAAALTAGRSVALNHEFREMPIFRAILDELSLPGTGDVSFVQVWQLMDLPPRTEAGWRGQLLQRTLYEAGVHLIDFLMVLFGEKPVTVQATTSACDAGEEGADAVVLVTLGFSRGRLAQVTQNRLCKGEGHYFDVRAETARSSLRASFGGRARLSAGLYRSTAPHARFEYGVSGIAWKEVGAKRTFLARNPKEPQVVATRLVFERTIEAFRTGTAPPTSGQHGRDVLEVIAACYESARTGRRLRLDDPALASLVAADLGGAPAA